MLAASLGVVAPPAHADGGPDLSLSGTGLLQPSFPSLVPGASHTTVTVVVRDHASRWLVAGEVTDTSTGTDFVQFVARYSPGGQLDPSFGVGGLITSGIGHRPDGYLMRLAVLNDGRIAIAGFLSTFMVIDANAVEFRTSPLRVQRFAPRVANQLAVLPDGRLVASGLVGTGPTATTNAPLVAILTVPPPGDVPPGPPDMQSTIVPMPLTQYSESHFTTDASGRMFVTACVTAGPATPECNVAVLTPNGDVDHAYGSNGVLHLLSGGQPSFSCQTSATPDGYLVAACASSWSTVHLDLYDPAGHLDSTFVSSIHQVDAAIYVRIAVEGTGRVFMLVREPSLTVVAQLDTVIRAFRPDGTVDTTFGVSGRVTARPASAPSGLHVDDSGGLFAYGFDQPQIANWIAAFDAPAGPAAQPPLVAPARFVPVTPTRILDTRAALGVTTKTQPAAGATVRLQVAGTAPIPASGVTAVVLNITADNAAAAGYVTAWPSGSPRPIVSNVNLDRASQTVANLAVVPVGPDGAVNLYTLNGSHLLADVAGYFIEATSARSGRYVSAGAPYRLLDTRTGVGVPPAKLSPQQQIDVHVTGVGPVPATGVSAVVLNLTGTEAAGAGYLTMWPKGSARPDTSALNLDPGGTRANLAIVPVGADGSVSIFTLNGSHVLADVSGWFTDDTAPDGTTGMFVAVPPTRMLDTRISPGVAITSGSAVARRIGATSVVPVGFASAVVANVTATSTTAPGYVTAYPPDQTVPEASTLNITVAGTTVSNLAITRLAGEAIALYDQSTSHLLIDVTGWFVA